MEPGVKEYLMKIVNTISFVTIWMVLNSTFGIMYHWANIEDRIHWKNLAFYSFYV